jgi:hypothetical protein
MVEIRKTSVEPATFQGTNSQNRNRNLADLRPIVIEIAKTFEIPWHLLERETPNSATSNDRKPSHRLRPISAGRGWFLTENNGRKIIAAVVDAKGSCSCRLYDA